MTRNARALLRGLCAVLGFAAGVPGAAAEPARTEFELQIVRGSVPGAQRALRVAKGDTVRLRITSDAAGELHVHGYRLAVSLAPNRIAELQFTARATGRFRLEWHPAGTAAPSGAHHGPALAVLEVRPR